MTAFAGLVLFAVGAVCGYLYAVVGHLIFSPRDCAAVACTGLGDVAWPVGTIGALVGGIGYTTLGFAAGLPRPRPTPNVVPESSADAAGAVERAAAALAQLTLVAGLPIVGPGALALIAWRAAPFLRRHAVAAVRLQLWQVLLIAPVPIFFWPSFGLYAIVAACALFGGLAYAVIGAVRAASGKLPAYPGNWPPTPPAAPQSIEPARRERRARLALGVLVVGIAANLVRVVLNHVQ